MSNTNHMGGYKRVIGATRCGNGLRGFRLNMRKLSIHKLRVKFLHLFRVLNRWKRSYERAIRSLRKGITYRRSSSRTSQSRLIATSGREERFIKPECRLRSLARTNSFYSEAIADCLEFIKRNSLSLDHPHDEAAPIAASTVAAIR
uniref:Uncharacterized protein n=1 Tax=Opuntia streptacantha TaxID=393608 RepID=A0A7C9A1R0_OPUST